MYSASTRRDRAVTRPSLIKSRTGAVVTHRSLPGEPDLYRRAIGDILDDEGQIVLCNQFRREKKRRRLEDPLQYFVNVGLDKILFVFKLDSDAFVALVRAS